MNARELLQLMIRTDRGSMTVWSKSEVASALDAYRAEILAEAKVETVAWLVKKAREYRSTGSSQNVRQAEAVEFLASKVDRGAVRAFLGTAHYRDALDAHRAEVLAETYPGELDMLRGLVATLHVVAQHGDLTDVRKLLAEHEADDAQARVQARAVSGGAAARPTGEVGR